MRTARSASKRRLMIQFTRRRLIPVRKAYEAIPRRKSRYAVYDYLREAYSAYLEIKEARATKSLRKVASGVLHKSLRAGTHPIRVVIEMTSTEPDHRVKSRWCRALQFAKHDDVAPQRLGRLFERNGGIAGCARRAAKASPSRWSPQRIWDE
jgi:hypothetical protein